MKKDEWEEIGVIGVDAGICWIGDPCYIIKDDGEHRAANLGKDWNEFCDKLSDLEYTQFNYDAGHPGLGVCVQSGYGDGAYPVSITRSEDGRVKSVRVDFIEEPEDD